MGTKKFRKKASIELKSRWGLFSLCAAFIILQTALDGASAMRHDAASIAEHAAEKQ
ncbi:hypothetical protein [Rugamonas rivuli]|uniref:hypothetical protein n=1 Tax=Rugamonas rivuli TaxID=2743358 RepID=UPI001581C516|nr:hypothetical protein [Rugamonas rivuli]